MTSLRRSPDPDPNPESQYLRVSTMCALEATTPDRFSSCAQYSCRRNSFRVTEVMCFLSKTPCNEQVTFGLPELGTERIAEASAALDQIKVRQLAYASDDQYGR